MNALIGDYFNNNDRTGDEGEYCDSESDDTLNESIDESDEIFLSFVVSDSKLGAALYRSQSHCIEMLADIDENNSFALIVSLLRQTEPTNLIVNSKCDASLLQMLRECGLDCDGDDQNDDFESASAVATPLTVTTTATAATTDSSNSNWLTASRFRLHIVAQAMYSLDSAKYRLLRVNLPNAPYLTDPNERFIYISSIVDMRHTNSVRALGALLRYLDKYRVGIQLEDNSVTIPVSSITYICLKELVFIDKSTFDSLNIFHDEWHPSTYKQGLQKKEGISLFGIFNRCVSKLGANYMRKLFLRPTQDIDMINNRLEAIEFFCDTRNEELKTCLTAHIKYIKNVNPILNKKHLTDFTVNDWRSIYKTIVNALVIRDIINTQTAGHLSIFIKIRKHFTDKLVEIANVMLRVIDFEESTKAKRFQVRAGFDEDLDNTCLTFKTLPNILNGLARIELMTYNQVFQECSCVYLPQMGFLISAIVIDNQQSDDSFESLGLSVSFKAADRRYFKNNHMRELDEEYGDIQTEIIYRQMQIMHRLQQMIVDERAVFESVMTCSAELDCLIAMADTALIYGYVKPRLTSDGVIQIVNGRHPIQELIVPLFVPNSYRSGNHYPKVKLLSGPNACGKSVFLKQVCLIVYLAHIGSFVPADAASITIVDKIFTRINTPESISTRLSAFSLDLNQISRAVANATKRSLVVVDEFGKGTQPNDGLALLGATLRHWFTTDTPHLVVSTHFFSITELLSDFAHLYETLTLEVARSGDEIVYKYRLINDKSNESIASYIAYLAGIPLHIINRGDYICKSIGKPQGIEFTLSAELQNKYSNYLNIASVLIDLNVNDNQSVERFLI